MNIDNINNKLEEFDPNKEYLLGEDFFDRLAFVITENKEVLEAYVKEAENIKRDQMVYFGNKLKELQNEIAEDASIPDDKLEEVFDERVKKLEEAVIKNAERDIELFLNSKGVNK